MKNKILFAFLFGIVLSLMINCNCYASWPIVITPTIKGHVLDATTNQPIENAIIEVVWHAMQVAPSDRVGKSVISMLLVTNKNGEFTVPKKWFFQPLGGLVIEVDQQMLTVRHPLYESKELIISVKNLRAYKKEGKLNKYDISLLSLENKYKEKQPVIGCDYVYFVLANRIKYKYETSKLFIHWENNLKNFDFNNKTSKENKQYYEKYLKDNKDQIGYIIRENIKQW